MVTPNLFSLFGGPRRAAEDALRASGNRRMQQVANNVAAATARTSANPVAVARLRNQALMEERNAQAEQRARMLAQADLQQQQDISQFIGGGLELASGIGGMLMGGPAGGAAGSALGGLGSSAVSQALGAGKTPPAAMPAMAQTLQSAPMQGAGRALGSPGGMPRRPQAPGPGFPQQAPGAAAQGLSGLPQQLSVILGRAQPAQAPAMGPQAAQGAPGVFGPQIPFGDLSDLLQPVLSDEDSKEAIRDASRAIDQFLRSVNPESFQYRDPQAAGAQPGRQAGVMAQDLERTPVGRQMVRQGPDGQRRIDPGSALSTLLAAQARLNDRLDSLERQQGPQASGQVGARAVPTPRVAPVIRPRGERISAAEGIRRADAAGGLPAVARSLAANVLPAAVLDPLQRVRRAIRPGAPILAQRNR